MPLSQKFLAKFRDNTFYHIICRSIDGKLLFYDDESRFYFLNKYSKLLNDFVDTYAYVLLNNHVHWLIKPKLQPEIEALLRSIPESEQTSTHKRYLFNECSFHELIEQQFNRLFIGYSLAVNKKYNRKGHLFNRPFKRIEINDNAHLTQLFIYIHANALKHRIVKDFANYKWSSYRAIISDKPTMLKRKECLEWFGGEKRFIEAHNEMSEYFYGHPLAGE